MNVIKIANDNDPIVNNRWHLKIDTMELTAIVTAGHSIITKNDPDKMGALSQALYSNNLDFYKQGLEYFCPLPRGHFKETIFNMLIAIQQTEINSKGL